MAGRPTKFNDARMNSICQALRDGCTVTSAVAATGIAESTYFEWLHQFTDFSEAVTRAKAESENFYVAALHTAAKPRRVVETVTTTDVDGNETSRVTEREEFDWRAAESWLKRRRREVWGDTLDLRRIDDDTLLRLLALEAGGDPPEPAD